MGLKVGQEASFAVQLNGARGLIDAKIHTPSGAIEECFITELDSGKTYTLLLMCKKLKHFTWSTTRLNSGSSTFLTKYFFK